MQLRSRPVSVRSGRLNLKVVFGLFGLLLGGVLGLVAVAPGLASKHGGDYVEEWFADNYHGRLSVGALDLSWRESQAVRDLELYDPAGSRVARVSLQLPPLWDLVKTRGGELGTVEVELEGEIVQAEDGTSNLSRAIQEKIPTESTRTSVPSAHVLVDVTSLSVRDATDVRPPLLLTDTKIDLTLEPGAPWILRVDGGLGAGHTEGKFDLAADIVAGPELEPQRVEAKAGGQGLAVARYLTALLELPEPLPVEPISFELTSLLASEARDFQLDLQSAGAKLAVTGNLHAAPFALPGVDASEAWDVGLVGEASGWAVTLVDAIAKQNGLLADVFGASMDLSFDLRIQGNSLEDARGPVELALESPNASLSIKGALDAGRFVSAEDSGLTVSLGLTPLVEERVVGPLLPMLVTPDRPPGAKPMQISLTGFELGLGEGIAGLAGLLRLELGPANFSFLPKIQSELDLPLNFGVRDGTVFGMRLDGGRVHYDALPIEIDGVQLPLGGSFNLATRTLDLKGSIPASLWGKQLEKKLGIAPGMLTKNLSLPFTIGGSPTSPKVGITPPDLGSMVGETLRDGLKGELEKALGDNLPNLKKDGIEFDGGLPKLGGTEGLGGALDGLLKGRDEKKDKDKEKKKKDGDGR